MAQTMRIARAPRDIKGKTLRSTENDPISGVETERELRPERRDELLRALKARFERVAQSRAHFALLCGS